MNKLNLLTQAWSAIRYRLVYRDPVLSASRGKLSDDAYKVKQDSRAWINAVVFSV